MVAANGKRVDALVFGDCWGKHLYAASCGVIPSASKNGLAGTTYRVLIRSTGNGRVPSRAAVYIVDALTPMLDAASLSVSVGLEVRFMPISFLFVNIATIAVATDDIRQYP